MRAALPFPIVITTNDDQLFDQALRRAKTMDGEGFKDPIRLIYNPDLRQEPELAPLDPPEDKPLRRRHDLRGCRSGECRVD